MKTRFWALAMILFACAVNAGCKKTAVDNSANNAVPVPTPVGTPVGNPVTVTIGSSGGSILSADGMVELQFPNGALSSNTQITIQSITNNAPNGLGNAYRFSPEGLKFSAPVNLVFHYTDKQVTGTMPDLMGVAFQDSSGIWYQVASFTVDSVNKTISAAINHFSDWAHFLALEIKPQSSTVKVSKSIGLACHIIDTDVPAGLVQGVYLLPLDAVPDGKFSTPTAWLVNGIPNGNSIYGTISPNGNSSTAVYTAPSKAPYEEPVSVTAQFDGTYHFNGKIFKRLQLIGTIQVIDGALFQLDLGYDNVDAFGLGLKYWDSSSVMVNVKSDNSVFIDSIQNFPPSVIPNTINNGGCTYTWVPAKEGLVNITEGAGYMLGSSDTVLVNLNNSGTNPSFNITCAGTTANTVLPGVSITPSFSFAFSIQDSIEMHAQSVGIGGTSGYFFYRVTRVSK